MSAPSPAIVAAFQNWKLAELAAMYAAPCPGEVMDQLVQIEGGFFEALQALPVTSPDDMLLKLFPILIREFEPKAGEHPLRPSSSNMYNYDADFLARLIADLGNASPILRSAMEVENPHVERLAA